MKIAAYPTTLGKIGRITDIHNQKRTFEIVGEISCWQGKQHDKRIYLQEIRHHDDDRLEYRFTYYMKGVKSGPTRGKWVYGQYSLMIPKRELTYLIKTARKRGWPGF